MNQIKKTPIEQIFSPIQRFIKQEKSGGIVLGLSVILALILANSPLSEEYHHFFEHKLGFIWDNKKYFEFDLHHWINDGLMAIFFFVVGLELKTEIVGGELSNPRKALLPIVAALGGMLVPAIIYFILNPAGEVQNGWGIPMATDIAFALGVLYLLGDKIPLSLKIFLTALAIVDDLGAVLVIAFFYTSKISLFYLSLGLLVLLMMFLGNKLGIKNVIFYAILGIFGVWVCFLMSGVHATIAAVLAAFAIPSDVKLNEKIFVNYLKNQLDQFKAIDPENQKPTLTHEQLILLESIKNSTTLATPLLQRLAHSMHPFVTFVVIPIFALANAGVSFNIKMDELFSTKIIFGVAFGLLFGKVIGVCGFTLIFVKLKIATLPKDMNFRNLLGLGFLASIGFTMSLFVTSLAFTHEEYIAQAKIGIFAASLIGGIIGYLILNTPSKQKIIL